MKFRLPPYLLTGLITLLLCTLYGTARAERIGVPYRGPLEELASSSSDEETEDGGGTVPDEGGGGGEEGGNPEENTGPSTGPAPTAGTGRGKTAVLDGKRLWNWWWEYNKDRFLARATVPGRVNAGSAYYWFGGGAKFPPRDVNPVSGQVTKDKVFPVLKKALKDANLAVRAEACIAVGRLGKVARDAAKKKKEGESDNLVVDALISMFGKAPTNKKAAAVRNSAILGLGISADADGCTFLMRSAWEDAGSEEEKAHILIALGLARYFEAIPLLVENLPKDNRRKPRESGIGALLGLGLMGPDALPDLEKAGAIKKLVGLARSGGSRDAVIIQAVTALGRLHAEFKKVKKAFSSRSKDVQYNAVLAMANYGTPEETKDAKEAAKFLMTKAFKAGEGQIKNFSVFAAGDLASRLGPNSPTRERILKHLRVQLEKHDIYLQGCAAIAVGVADDRGAGDLLRKLVNESKDPRVLAGASLGLGLMRSTESVDAIREKVMLQNGVEADSRGDAAVGIALAGDTTRIGELTQFHTKHGISMRIKRHTPVAIGVLGSKDHAKNLVAMFSRPVKTRDEIKNASSAAFAMSYLREQAEVGTLVRLAGNNSPQVRGMAIIALGRMCARDRVDPLTRCFENMSHNNKFRWEILYDITQIV